MAINKWTRYNPKHDTCQ